MHEVRLAKRWLGRQIANKVHQDVKLLAKRTGYPRVAIFRLCNGYGRFDQDLVLAVARVAEVPQEVVFRLLAIIHAPAPPGPRRFRRKATVKRTPHARFR